MNVQAVRFIYLPHYRAQQPYLDPTQALDQLDAELRRFIRNVPTGLVEAVQTLPFHIRGGYFSYMDSPMLHVHFITEEDDVT